MVMIHVYRFHFLAEIIKDDHRYNVYVCLLQGPWD